MVIACLAACGPKAKHGVDAAGGGDGGVDASGGGGDATDAQNCGELNVTLRDFPIAHPDFEENGTGDDRGLVKVDLGVDNKL